MPPSTLRDLAVAEAEELRDGGAAYVDLGPVDDYLDVHVPGSLALLYEFGPGLASRARDCLPLDLPLILLDSDKANSAHAAASLRGKGFTVEGVLPGGVTAWGQELGAPGSTEVVEGSDAPEGWLLDVGDPLVDHADGAVKIPVEQLWSRTDEIEAGRVVVAGGVGVRAALAVGILERAGIEEILFWKTRSAKSRRKLEPYG
jgi:hydroxyacylglutathione hydrolase